MEKQMREVFYESIRQDLSQDPPNTLHVSKLVAELVDGLCKFVPSKTQLHVKIKEDILSETLDIETMPSTIFGLINWIEKFQAPIYDTVTNKWRDEFKATDSLVDFIVKFLHEYYTHVEKMYKETWEARRRLVDNESIIPPEHRPVVTGKNGIPDVMKSGM